MPIRPLDPVTDRPAVAAILTEAQDYCHLWLGHAPDASQVDEVYTAGPPGCDAAQSFRLGLWLDATLSGVAELSFGYPAAQDAYLGLMILAPGVRVRAQPSTPTSRTLPASGAAPGSFWPCWKPTPAAAPSGRTEALPQPVSRATMLKPATASTG